MLMRSSAYSDIMVLRDLAKCVSEISEKEIQDERRDLWRKHNSLKQTTVPINIHWHNCWQEIYPDKNLMCKDSFYREHECYLRQMLFQDSLDDDSIVEPWITVKPRYAVPTENFRWGPEIKYIKSSEERGSYLLDPPIKKPEDMKKLVTPHHKINETATAEDVSKLQDAIGDIIEINVDRGPYYRILLGDISHDLGELLSITQLMWDVIENPEELHSLVRFLADGVMAVHDEAEVAGDWQLSNSYNQSLAYSEELPDPRANSGGINRDKLWVFMAAQEFNNISPSMFEEFLLRYQIPILEKFGLCSYGCCEDLTGKIVHLRKINNLRRIAVTPWADIRSCAEQIGNDYVLSWRPNPSEVICSGFEPELIRRVVKNAMDIFYEHNSCVDITLKDIETVQGKPENLREWVKIVRAAIN